MLNNYNRQIIHQQTTPDKKTLPTDLKKRDFYPSKNVWAKLYCTRKV